MMMGYNDDNDTSSRRVLYFKSAHVCFSALFLTSSADSATFPAASCLPSSAFDFPHPNQLNQPDFACSAFLSASARASEALRSAVPRAWL